MTQLYILVAIIGWGIGTFLSKGANNALHPLMVSSISLAFYCVMMPILWLTVKFDHTVNVSGVLYTLVGALFMCVGTLGLSYALRNGAPVGQATVLSALYPVLTLVLSMVFLKEELTVQKGIGIVLALGSFALLSIK